MLCSVSSKDCFNNIHKHICNLNIHVLPTFTLQADIGIITISLPLLSLSLSLFNKTKLIIILLRIKWFFIVSEFVRDEFSTYFAIFTLQKKFWLCIVTISFFVEMNSLGKQVKDGKGQNFSCK